MGKEFSIIDAFFSHIGASNKKSQKKEIILSVGDDCALITPSPALSLAISMDTLVSGTHFFKEASGYEVGYKALAVNLSDIAAMGAKPKWFTLALTLPNVNEVWLKSFSEGLQVLASQFNTPLIGGDTTQGPLSVTIQIAGEVQPDLALRRDKAQANDLIFVSGTLGGAGLGLEYLLKKTNLNEAEAAPFVNKLKYPIPQVKLGQQLRSIAHACIDLSDGLQGDLQHILQKSQVGAKILLEAIPLYPNLLKYMTEFEALKLALTFGDDYELCFTVPAKNRKKVLDLGKKLSIPLYEIGTITEQKKLQLFYKNTVFQAPQDWSSYEHF